MTLAVANAFFIFMCLCVKPIFVPHPELHFPFTAKPSNTFSSQRSADSVRIYAGCLVTDKYHLQLPKKKMYMKGNARIQLRCFSCFCFRGLFTVA